MPPNSQCLKGNCPDPLRCKFTLARTVRHRPRQCGCKVRDPLAVARGVKVAGSAIRWRLPVAFRLQVPGCLCLSQCVCGCPSLCGCSSQFGCGLRCLFMPFDHVLGSGLHGKGSRLLCHSVGAVREAAHTAAAIRMAARGGVPPPPAPCLARTALARGGVPPPPAPCLPWRLRATGTGETPRTPLKSSCYELHRWGLFARPQTPSPAADRPLRRAVVAVRRAIGRASFGRPSCRVCRRRRAETRRAANPHVSSCGLRPRMAALQPFSRRQPSEEAGGHEKEQCADVPGGRFHVRQRALWPPGQHSQRFP